MEAGDKKRKFAIRSEFGGPRQWRGKKSRPCDVCRRRKTACIIETEPPCKYCNKMGLPCQSSAQPNDVDAQSSPGQGSVYSSVHASLAKGRQGRITTAVRREPRDSRNALSSAPQGVDLTVHTIEDNPGRTAMYMGPTAEQDPDILVSFKSSIVSELDEVDAEMLQVHPSGLTMHDPPVQFGLVLNDFPAADDAARQAASDAIERKVAPHGPALVRLFFRHIHPTLPVLMKTRFLRQYVQDKGSIPASLRGAVYALASAFWKHEPSINGSPCPFQQSELQTHALDSLRREMVSSTLASLQGCLLLQHIKPPDTDSIESNAILSLSAQATVAAHMMGLHKDPGAWNIAPWEKILRKRLWWATFVADAWSAQAFGTPFHIQSHMYSTLPMEMEDMMFDQDVPSHLGHLLDPEDAARNLESAARFIETANLAHMSRRALDVSLQRGMPLGPDAKEVQRQLVETRQRLEEWRRLLPCCLGNLVGPSDAYGDNAPLHLAYHATQAILLRGLMAPATAAAKADPDSAIRKWFQTALQASGSFTAFVSRLGVEELDGFWGRYGRPQLTICGNFLIYLFLLAVDPRDVASAFALLESFHDSLERLNGMADANSRMLIRPVALRIDSFFIFASPTAQQAES